MQSILPYAGNHAASRTILHTDTDKITGDGMETYCNHFRIHSSRMLNI
ncbi:hypothetical protein [Erysipelatoclostridium sp. DFI.2.3]|nr:MULTISPECIES: hypothetical protein [Thomasclavelia]